MKKHIIIFAAAITPLAFFSCTKQTVQPEQANMVVDAGEQGLLQKRPHMPIVDLQWGLDGKFEFNGNLKEKTGQLKDAVSNSHFKPSYTADRKGMPGKAIAFNGGYGLIISNVPLDTNTSVAVWVKYDIYPTDFLVPLVEGSQSLAFHQLEDTYQASSWNGISGQYVISGAISRDWHHLVATRDANTMNFYIDGVLVGSSPTPAGGGPSVTLSEFVVGFGYNAGYKYWKGSMDDLCFYGRTLSYADVVTLYNQ